jgi:hypothetical protein
LEEGIWKLLQQHFFWEEFAKENWNNCGNIDHRASHDYSANSLKTWILFSMQRRGNGPIAFSSRPIPFWIYNHLSMIHFTKTLKNPKWHFEKQPGNLWSFLLWKKMMFPLYTVLDDFSQHFHFWASFHFTFFNVFM